MSDIDENIRRTIESGQFVDLPGKGKPLNLDDDAWVDSGWRLAYHLLKSAGYTLPWIELLKGIDADIETARMELRRAWHYRTASLAEDAPAAGVDAEWQRAQQAFREQVEQLNQRICDHNLQAPSEKFQRRLLNSEAEINKVKS